MSGEYLSAVARTDRLLGRVLAALPASGKEVLLVVTADHGGRDSHRDAGDADNFTIPFLAWGDGVPPGTDLYELNPQLADPGDDRPGYAGAQPVRNGFVANLVTTALGLPPVAGSTLDVDQSFRVWSSGSR
jgi:arylsulfatase A-like enzyme